MTISSDPISGAPISGASEPAQEVELVVTSSALVEDTYDYEVIPIPPPEAGSSLQISTDVFVGHALSAINKLYVSESQTLTGDYILNISESARIKSIEDIPHALSIVESLIAEGGFAYTLIRFLDTYEHLVATGESADVLGSYLLSFTQAITVAATSTVHHDMTLQDVLDVVSDHPLLVRYLVDFADTVVASSSIENLAIFALTMDESVVADPGMDFIGSFLMDLSEGIHPYTRIQIGDDTIEGWVMNMDTEGFSQYSNYPFNSLAEMHGKYYGLTESGLYLLEGDDDDGEPIDAVIRTGLLDFGSHYLKNATMAYVGRTSAGQLILKVIVTDLGQKKEWWYELRPTEADNFRDGRVEIGRGLRSRYWQFEIVNKDGGDFDIDDVTLLYQILNRRVR